MPKEQLSPLEKANKKRKAIVQSICNRILMQNSFGNIKTWRDIYRWTGIESSCPPEKSLLAVTIDDVKTWNKKLLDDLEATIRAEQQVKEIPKEVSMGNADIPQVEEPVVSPPLVLSPTTEITDESGYNNTNDYGLQPSPREKAYLYYFQKKATKEILDKIL